MSETKIMFRILRIRILNLFRICSTRAFSLLELVISMAILSIALLGLIQMFPVGLRASKHAGDHTMMTFLGQQKMSDIEQSKPIDSTTSNTIFSEYPSFSWVRTVTNLNNLMNVENLYRASVLIYSNDGGDTRIEEFTTLYVK
ncbi:prepilin-type N-terminal cleavage/methylation domain-containing protein [bacterium]|nr:prepilin-type N-terminal cleavage/methylation domain-containing protein [bacterium]